MFMHSIIRSRKLAEACQRIRSSACDEQRRSVNYATWDSNYTMLGRTRSRRKQATISIRIQRLGYDNLFAMNLKPYSILSKGIPLLIIIIHATFCFL